MTDMPTTYETTTSATTNTSQPSSFGPHFEYIKTIPGILKIVECVLSLITFICAITVWWSSLGGGWVQFVAISAFITTLILFFGYFFGFYYRLPDFRTLILLSLIVFICSCVWMRYPGQGWLQFVAITGLLSSCIFIILHLINLINRFPGPWLLVEFVYYCVFTIFFLIAAIVAAVHGSLHAAIGASAFFAFAATAVYAVDTFFQFRAYRDSQAGMTSQGQTVTTTTTTTSHMEASKTTY